MKITDESLLNDKNMSQHLKEFYQSRLNELGNWEKVYEEAEQLFVEAEKYEAASAMKKCKEYHQTIK
jgi:hypothetical protein